MDSGPASSWAGVLPVGRCNSEGRRGGDIGGLLQGRLQGKLTGGP